MPSRGVNGPGEPDAAAPGTGAPVPKETTGAPARSTRYIDRDLTSGSIPRNLFHLSWPQGVEGVFTAVDQITDTAWAGRLASGPHALAGVSVVLAWTMMAASARTGLDSAMRAMIARAIGGKDTRLANHVALQAFTVTLASSVFIVVAGMFLADPLMKAVGASSSVRAQAGLYMRLQFVFIGLWSVRTTLGSALQVSGDPLTALKSTALARAIHIVLSPLLMFGWAGFPELGLAGASAANIVGQSVGMVINVHALFRGNTLLRLTFRGYAADPPLWWRFFKIGYPASISGMDRGVGQLVLLRIVAPFGDTAVAVFGLVRRVETMSTSGSSGVGQATGTLVGQNLGAGRPGQAKQAVFWGVVFVFILQAVICVAIFLAPGTLLGVFTHDTDIVSLGSDWLRIQAFAVLFMAVSIVFQQAYNTAGDTVPPMVVTLVSLCLVEVPLAWVLAHWSGVGLLGIAYALVATMGLRLLCYVPYFFTGRWLKVRVL